MMCVSNRRKEDWIIWGNKTIERRFKVHHFSIVPGKPGITNVEMWTDILSTNGGSIAGALNDLSKEIEILKVLLNRGNEDDLRYYLEQAQAMADGHIKKK
jgi:hypothetical protein